MFNEEIIPFLGKHLQKIEKKDNFQSHSVRPALPEFKILIKSLPGKANTDHLNWEGKK